MFDIMKQIQHMKTTTLEQIQEREKEAMRLIIENHNREMIELKIQIQEIKALTPKRQIYFGKVKTE